MMNFQGMPIQVNQSLHVELDPLIYQFNRSKISGLYFGNLEPMVLAMIDEINLITKNTATRMKKALCCTFMCFFCFPCIICCMICELTKIQTEFKEQVQKILDKNKQTLEGNGFTCSLATIQVESGHHGHHRGGTSYRLEFQKYSIVNQLGMMGGMSGQMQPGMMGIPGQMPMMGPEIPMQNNAPRMMQQPPYGNYNY